MTDTAGEVLRLKPPLRIPTAMIAAETADTLRDICAENPAVTVTVRGGESDAECAICQSPFSVGDETVEVPQCHHVRAPTLAALASAAALRRYRRRRSPLPLSLTHAGLSQSLPLSVAGSRQLHLSALPVPAGAERKSRRRRSTPCCDAS